ncbi:protein ILRUN [Halyomorpha halys]|uniref:protein ILRUN n=1 Tax=Halyomorpha halys TaxID=286706 RepID=UPI0006D4FF76|nr:uncharacterized protein C6orf106 homolog [Halyomorpha halys]
MVTMETDGDFVDQQLLQQFRCLGTTDKDELVKQLKMLVGNHIGTASAIFLLDMNNWNLQAAVGSYFDFEIPLKLPAMSLVRDEPNNNIFKITPCTAIDKVWVLLNNGDEHWPQGCCLQFCGGDTLCEYQKIPVPCLAPNQTTQILIHLVSPKVPGVYKSQWRMITSSGTYFGDIIWVIMTVMEDDTSNLVKQLSDLNTCSESSTSSNNRVESDGIQNPFGMHP